MHQTITLAVLVTSIPLLLASDSRGQRTWEAGIQGELDGMSYRYYLPADYDSSLDYPLVLFLHSAGRWGTDNARHISTPQTVGLIDKTESEYPAILVAPQLPSGSWGPTRTTDNTEELLTQLVDTLSVDTNRLYVTGYSMGGFGSLEYAQSYNAEGRGDLRFAAVAPFSGASLNTSRPGVPEKLLDTPIWLVHGSTDTTVHPDASRDTFRILAGLEPSEPILFTENHLGHPTAIAGKTRYTEIPGRGHGGWFHNYGDNTFYDWMFAQSTAIPEPSTLLLAVISSVPLLLRRKNHFPHFS